MFASPLGARGRVSRLRAIAACLVLGSLLALPSAGCRSEAEPGGQEDATAAPGAPAAEAPGEADAAPSGAGPSEADRAVAELKAAARRLLAADRAVVSNRRGYEQAVERQKRDLALSDLHARIPTNEVTPRLVEAHVLEPAGEHGLAVVEVKVGQADEAPPVPAEHRGEGPYRYDVDQIVARHPVILTVTPADEGKLRPFFEEILRGEGPMLDLVGVRIAGDRATFTGDVYVQRDVTPPTHVVETPTLEGLAKDVGVRVPRGHARLDEVRALLDQHRALEPELEPAMEALGRAHLLGRLFQFHRDRAKAIERRTFPDPVRVGPPKQDDP